MDDFYATVVNLKWNVLTVLGAFFYRIVKRLIMSGTLGTRLVWSLAVLFIQNAEATIFIPCPSVQRDFYPGVEPQNSSPPYVLNVTDEDGQPLPDLSYYGGHLRYNGKNPSFKVI